MRKKTVSGLLPTLLLLGMLTLAFSIQPIRPETVEEVQAGQVSAQEVETFPVLWRKFLGDVSPAHVATGDIDGDGVADVVVEPGYLDQYMYEQRLYTIHVLKSDGSTLWSRVMTKSAAPVGVADLDGAGKSEAIVHADHADYPEFNTTTYAFDSNGTRLWRHVDSTEHNTGPIAFADLDLDGLPEIVTTHVGWASHKTHAYDGDGTLMWEFDSDWPSDLTASDVTGDGIDEVIIGNQHAADEGIIVLNTTGSVVWKRHVNWYGESWCAQYLKVGDITGDGINDIIAISLAQDATPINVLYAVRGSDGSLLWQSNFERTTEALATIPILTDIDGDGIKDVVLGAEERIYAIDNDGELLWIFGNETFPGVRVEPFLFDYNRDGKDEILFRKDRKVYEISTVGEATLIGEFENELHAHLSVHATGIRAFADVNGDGFDELVVHELIDGENYVAVVTCSRVLSVPEDYSTIQAAINAADRGDTIYVSSGTYYENIVVNQTVSLVGENRSTTIIDGNGSDTVVYVTADNVSISSFTIQNSGPLYMDSCIYLYQSSYSSIISNLVTKCWIGIFSNGSTSVNIKSNIVTGNMETVYYGIRLDATCDSVIGNNTIESSIYDGVSLGHESCGNHIYGNTLFNNRVGIVLAPHGGIGNNCDNLLECNDLEFNREWGVKIVFSPNNTVVGNMIIENDFMVWWSPNNEVYHNNFVNSTAENVVHPNIWDNGYPSGGNYWSDYDGIDKKRGPDQHIGGSDGIGDTPYIIDEINQDRYPLMNPWTAPDIAVVNVTLSKSIIGQGFALQIDATVTNQGNKIEAFNVTAYANKTVIQTESIILRSERSKTITFTWNTTSVSIGNYVISTTVTPLPSETDTADNTYDDGWFTVTILGDIDGDFDVDKSDLVDLEVAYGSTYSSPTWNANCDINGDNKVDVTDLFIQSKNYGESVP